jgi:hypothetical protein
MIKISLIKHFFLKKKNSQIDNFITVEEKTDELYNKINILSKLKSIPHFNLKYETIIDYENIRIEDTNNDIDENLLKTQYLIINYNFDKNISIYSLHDYLLGVNGVSNIKNFICRTLVCYEQLLKNIFALHEKKISFFNLELENIIIYNENPILIHFEDAYKYNLLSYNKIIYNKILKKSNFSYYPFEVYIINFLIKNKKIRLSYDDIEEITNNYISNLFILKYLSSQFKEKFTHLCTELLEGYLNIHVNKITEELLTHQNSWDNYGLSIIFINIICLLIKNYNFPNSFFKDLLSILIKNINPNPFKRTKINSNFEKLDNIYKEYSNWDYINKFSYEIDKIKNLL